MEMRSMSGWGLVLGAVLGMGCGPSIETTEEMSGSETAVSSSATGETRLTTGADGGVTSVNTTERPGDSMGGDREDLPLDVGRAPIECGFYERLPEDEDCILPELPRGHDYLPVCVPLPRGVESCEECTPDCILHEGEQLIACDWCFTEVVSVHCGPYVDDLDRCCYYVEHEGIGCAE